MGLALAALAPATAAQAAGGGTPYPGAPAPASAAATLAGGRAVAPAGAPAAVRRMLTAANRLIRKPYRYGGGHRRPWPAIDSGYDCSGAVSYALYGARLLTAPLDSTGLARFGRRGPGEWVTVYANRSHTFIVIAGLRFDTGYRDAAVTPAGSGPRWAVSSRSTRGFAARHPNGL